MDENKDVKKRNIAIRNIIVFVVALVAVLGFIIYFRADYLNILEIDNQYTDIFFKNVNNKLYLAGSIFVITYLIIYISNKIIKHGLKKFFDEDKKQMPKLPNKTLAMIGSIIASVFGIIMLTQKYTMFANIAWFGKSDPVFNTDIGYYIFSVPFIEAVITFAIIELICLIIYIALYYVVVMNTYLDGVDIEVLKKNTLIKQILFIVAIIALLASIYIFITSQNILTQDMVTIQNDNTSIDLIGAGKTDVTVKLWGYRIFSVVLFVAVLRLLKYAKKANFKQSMISVAIVPTYLIGMFICMVYHDQFIVKKEILDNQKEYIGYNINNTKDAFGINIDQKSIDSYDTITYDEIASNKNVVDNIPIISKDITQTTIKEHQEEGVYYSYDETFMTLYDSQIAYLTPREILSNNSMSYNNRTFKYTHGYSAVINSASEVDENGYTKYLLSDFSFENSKIKQPRIYFGLKTDSTIVTNSNYGKEYDYPITATNYVENEYDGKAGLNLGFWDRLVVAISSKNFKLAFSGNANKDSKIISNRNIIERAKVLLPYIVYDDDPYMVINNEGKMIWVLDGYTVSNEYPYSQRTKLEVDGDTQEINYIRNSVKVLVDSYDGTIKFYITDRNDPIIMAYRNLYPTLFQDLDEQIPEDISSQFIYPKLLYKVQANMINIYHDISEDVLYRADDIWEITPTESQTKTAAVGVEMEPYYTMLKIKDNDKANLGLMITFNKESKQNINAYLVGTYENGNPKLSLYKFDSESNVASILQLSSQIEQDETISQELENLNVSGTKLIKNLVIVPIDDTLLYVEPVYQVRLNESEIPVLKKVIVASGNKLAIGDSLENAISNLFTDYAVDLEIIDMQDLESVIDAIIRSNENLSGSLSSNDFEMIGKDLSELESLINRLEELRKVQISKEEKEEDITNESSEQTNSIQNDISTNNVDNSILEN